MPSSDFNFELDLGEPPPELVMYSREHCGEDPSTRLQAIYELKDMIFERGECTPHRMDDEFLIRFLRARNFVPQRAHRLKEGCKRACSTTHPLPPMTSAINPNQTLKDTGKMVNYYRFKQENPQLFENIYPLDLREIGDANIIAVPPYRDQEGRRVMIYRIGCWDPKVIPVDDLFKATIFALELGLLEQRTQILGGVAVFDLENISTQHAWQITPSIAAKIVKLLVSSFPAITQAIHIINHSWMFDKMYNIFKPLLTSAMRSRIYFHGYDVTSLHKHVHPDYLPERYGGIWPDYSYTNWLESLRKNDTVAKEMVSYGYKFREEDLAPEVVRKLKIEGVELS